MPPAPIRVVKPAKASRPSRAWIALQKASMPPPAPYSRRPSDSAVLAEHRRQRPPVAAGLVPAEEADREHAAVAERDDVVDPVVAGAGEGARPDEPRRRVARQHERRLRVRAGERKAGTAKKARRYRGRIRPVCDSAGAEVARLFDRAARGFDERERRARRRPVFAREGERTCPPSPKPSRKPPAPRLSAKRGDTPKSKLKGASRQMVESMTEKQLEEFASTKRKGKPEHVGD